VSPRAWRLAALLALALAAGLVAADAAQRVSQRRGGGPDWAPAEAMLKANGDITSRLALGEAALSDAPAQGRGLVLAKGGAPLAPAELDALASFAARGGRVVVLGDPDAAARLGSGVASAPILLAGNASFPDAHAVLDPRPGARVAAWSANGSFVDVDGDGRATAADAPGPFALATWSPDGRVLVVGSAGWLSPDALRDPAGAAEAQRWLAQAFPPGTRVALDAAHDAPWPAAIPGSLQDAAATPQLGAPVALALAASGLCAALGLAREEGRAERRGLDAPVRREDVR